MIESAPGSEIVKAAEERDYDIIVLTGEQAEEAGEAIAPFVTENCLVVFENMTLEQVQKGNRACRGGFRMRKAAVTQASA